MERIIRSCIYTGKMLEKEIHERKKKPIELNVGGPVCHSHMKPQQEPQSQQNNMK